MSAPEPCQGRFEAGAGQRMANPLPFFDAGFSATLVRITEAKTEKQSLVYQAGKNQNPGGAPPDGALLFYWPKRVISKGPDAALGMSCSRFSGIEGLCCR